MPLGALMKGLSDVTTAARQTVSEARPQELAGWRHGFVEQQGQHALVDVWAQISTPRGLLSYLPRALLIGVFAPFPWQWFYTEGSTGVMRVLSGVEMLFWYFLVPGLLIGSRKVITSRRADQLFLLAFGVLVLVPIALVIPNLGTLYRLRLSALLPLLIIVAAGDPRRFYEDLRHWMKAHRARRVALAFERDVTEPASVEISLRKIS
ncbi:MAG: hypothetical protein HYY58_01335 [Candidatus Omnitrophica bacterium]|nr:hypothetical protein [Candidatus Omnitrophota bacterium]